jgi:hypothetical protein
MLNNKRTHTGDVITITAHQEIDIKIELEFAGSSAECSSDESDEDSQDMNFSDSDFDISSDESSSDSDYDVKDTLYSDTMTLGELKAGHERLERFLDKSSKNQPMSFVELYQVFDDGAKFVDFRRSAKKGTAELIGSDMAAQAFNLSPPSLKKHFLDEALGDTVRKTAVLMFLSHPSEMRDIVGIRYYISKKIREIGDVIEAKNKERYEAVAKMPAYNTTIAMRRAEVEASLDAANQKEYLAQKSM